MHSDTFSVLPGGEGPKSSFLRPDVAHSPAAYWFWHQLPTPGEVRRQVKDMYDGGFRTFLIQCRLAFPRDNYLDDRYLAAYRTAVDAAQKLGMQVGVYDEYNWQSGLAGGRTVKGADHLREQHIFWTTCSVTSPTCSLWLAEIHSSVEALGQAAMEWQYEDGSICWTDWQIVAALVYPAQGARFESIKDVTMSARIGFSSLSSCRIDVSVSSESSEKRCVTVFVSARCSTSRVPNYLMKETALRFIEVAYEPFRAVIAEYFGQTVGYFFFDQPHASFYNWPHRHGNLLTSLPFSPNLIGFVEVATGRSFALTLLALVIDIGPDTGTIRANFYQAFSRLTTRNFLGTLQSWTAQQGLFLSGHEVLGHVGTWHPHKAFADGDLRVNFGLDYFGVDAYRGMTCVDAEGCVPQLSAKMGDSVSRSQGRTGCTVEQYFVSSGSGPNRCVGMWELSLEQLRAQAFRLHLSGAKQFLFHAFYQSDGDPDDLSVLRNPRFDFAPGVNFEPWWPFHRAFAEESARLSTFVDEASLVCELAILYPLRTAWAEGPGHSYGDHIEFWSAFLAERGYGYHFIDESDLLRARIHGTALCVDGRRYQSLVLPSVTTLQAPSSLDMLERFLAAGGTVIASGETPVRYQRSEGANAGSHWDSMVRRYGGGLWSFRDIPFPADVDRLIRPMVGTRPYVESQTKSLWQWVGKDDFGWRLAIFNDHHHAVHAVVQLPFPVAELEIWDVSSGAIRPVATIPSSELELHLESMELRCLRIGERPSLGSAVDRISLGATSIEELLKESDRMALSSDWSLFVDKGNTVIKSVDVTLGWEVQGLANFSGVGTYVCNFDISDARGCWWLYLPSVHAAVVVELNGARVGERGWSPYIFALPPGLLRSTRNTLRLHVFSSAANRYLAGTSYRLSKQASGLLGVPQLVRQNARATCEPR